MLNYENWYDCNWMNLWTWKNPGADPEFKKRRGKGVDKTSNPMFGVVLVESLCIYYIWSSIREGAQASCPLNPGLISLLVIHLKYLKKILSSFINIHLKLCKFTKMVDFQILKNFLVVHGMWIYLFYPQWWTRNINPNENCMQW